MSLVLVPVGAAMADEWWMLQNTDDGRKCGPPLEGDGVVLTPDEILNRFEECKLMDETPSLELKNVMIECGGNLNQVFIFSRSKESCEALAKD
ncbi:MAG: hypothetical protein M5U16_12555 [Hyphomicrobium sp.]|nr:hypothetical protein [Hyphomicrobium sp.]